MSVYYNPGKENIVADALIRLSIGSVAHVEEERKELVKDVHRLARLGVRIICISDNCVKVMNRTKSSLVVEVKENKTVIQFFLNIRMQSTIREWRFSPKREMVYFASRVDCVFVMWESLESISLQRTIT